MKKVLLVVLFICVLPISSYGAQREVGPGQPYGTIQSAINASSSGDTVNVHNDTYAENVTINVANLYLVANTQRGPVIDPTSTGNAITVSSSGVTVDGFEITGWNPVSTEQTDGIRNSGHNGVSVLNCEIHDGPSASHSASGIYVRNSASFLASGNYLYSLKKGLNITSGHSTDGTYANGIILSNNEIHDNSVDGIDILGQYITIRGNNIYDNMDSNWTSTHPDGIQIIASTVDNYSSAQHVRIYNNMIRNHTQGIYTEGTSTNESSNCSDVHIFNNVLYMTPGVVNGADMDTINASNINIDSSKDVYIYNNTFGRAGNNDIYMHNNANGTIHIENNIFDNNLGNGVYTVDTNDIGSLDYNVYHVTSGSDVKWGTSYYTLAQLQSATAYGDHGVADDPTLNAYPTPTLQAGSPAINAGIVLGVPYDIDKNGKSRGNIAWDVGAYEFDTVGPSGPYLEPLESGDSQ